jgi:hypothetical protein
MVRTGVGVLLLLIAVPLLAAGGGLWLVMQHRADDGAYTARLERVRADGNAIVVTDVDALLRADLPVARGGQTTLHLRAQSPAGALFVGVAPRADVERYLAGVAQTRILRVRPARGPLPVDTETVPGAAFPPDWPIAQRFWLASNLTVTDTGEMRPELAWAPSSLRGRELALVVMNPDGSAGVDATIAGRLRPGWLPPTVGGLLILGTAVFLLGVVALAAARRMVAAEPAIEAATEPVPVPVRPVRPPRLEVLDVAPAFPVPARTPVQPPADPPAEPFAHLPPVGLRFTWPPVARSAGTPEKV